MNTILNSDAAEGNTPLDYQEVAQLIPNLANRRELDEWERQNILRAHSWCFNPRVMKRRDPLDEIYLRELHRRMFDQTWKWAGQYRKSDKNFGCPYPQIYQRMPVLLGNARYWIQNHTFSVDEIAIRFHHQLVWEIHAFPNGNGRHARLLADVIAAKYGCPKFTWGRTNLVNAEPARQAYLNALHALDQNINNVGPLLEFARS